MPLCYRVHRPLLAVVGWRCIMVSFYISHMHAGIFFPAYIIYAGTGVCIILFSREARAALQEWEAQVCLMSQRIPASAGLERKKRDHQFTLSARTFFVHKGT